MIKKIVLFGILPLLIILLAVWGYCETAHSDSYDYQGYITAIRNTSDGTVITTISGETTSEFTLQRYTREKFNGELTSLQEGAHIKLSTTRHSTNIKKFSAYTGFSLEGKIVFMDNLESPFLLTRDEVTQVYRLHCLITHYDVTLPLTSGSQVRIYYQYPIGINSPSVVVDVIEQTSDLLDLPTDEEIAYITERGYTLAP